MRRRPRREVVQEERMSHSGRHEELGERTQQLLRGSLKHVRAAALAVALVPLATVAVSQAVVQVHASGGVAPPVPSPCDFVTSGGFIVKDLPGEDGKKANFGAHGGCKYGEFWGHVNFVDHSTGYHVSSSQITAYLAPLGMSDRTRDICGLATTNRSGESQPIFFRVRLVDNGEPGTQDLFGIVLADPVLGGETYRITPRVLSSVRPGAGNVQLHNPNSSTTAPAPESLLDEATLCGGLSFDSAPPVE
jgi:hypothetical protein